MNEKTIYYDATFTLLMKINGQTSDTQGLS